MLADYLENVGKAGFKQVLTQSYQSTYHTSPSTQYVYYQPQGVLLHFHDYPEYITKELKAEGISVYFNWHYPTWDSYVKASKYYNAFNGSSYLVRAEDRAKVKEWRDLQHQGKLNGDQFGKLF